MRLMSPPRRRGLIVLLLLGSLGAAAQQAPPAVHPALWPTARSPVSITPDTTARVAQLLGRLTLEEKVAQLLQADLRYLRPEDLSRYPLGALLAAGTAGPDAPLRVSAARWREVAESYRRAALTAASPAHAPI